MVGREEETGRCGRAREDKRHETAIQKPAISLVPTHKSKRKKNRNLRTSLLWRHTEKKTRAGGEEAR